MPRLTPIFVSWHQSRRQNMHASPFQLTLFTLSAVCILLTYTHRNGPHTRVERISPTAVSHSYLRRSPRLSATDKILARSLTQSPTEAEDQDIVAPVNPSQGRICLPCHPQPPATTTAPPWWPMLLILLPTPTRSWSIPTLLPINCNLLAFRTARGHFSNEPFGMHHSF